jgi:hypothetical protein
LNRFYRVRETEDIIVVVVFETHHLDADRIVAGSTAYLECLRDVISVFDIASVVFDEQVERCIFLAR